MTSTTTTTTPLTTREPVLTTAGITAGATAIVALLVAFAVPLTDAQQVAILGVVAVVAPGIVAISRRWVTPNASVVERTENGVVLAGPANDVVPADTEIRDLGSDAAEPEGYDHVHVSLDPASEVPAEAEADASL